MKQTNEIKKPKIFKIKSKFAKLKRKNKRVKLALKSLSLKKKSRVAKNHGGSLQNKSRDERKMKKSKSSGPSSHIKTLKKNHSEKTIQQKFCAYIRKNYPSVVFTSMGDFSSARQAGKSIKLGYCRYIHDIVIFEPRGWYFLCMMELKTEEVKYNGKIITRKGKLSKGQNKMIEDMSKKRYFSCAVYGLQAAIKIFDVYMSLKSGEKIIISN